MNKEQLIEKLNNNEVIAHPTDSVFGLMAKINKNNIYKINELKKRNLDQPLQILFFSINDALKYSIKDYFTMEYLNLNYEEGTSYIVDASEEFSKKNLIGSFKRTYMFRIPLNKYLKEIIKEVGPLFATSANIHNEETLINNFEIEKIFNVPTSDLKQENNKSSKIISLINNEIKELR